LQPGEIFVQPVTGFQVASVHSIALWSPTVRQHNTARRRQPRFGVRREGLVEPPCAADLTPQRERAPSTLT